MDDWPYSIEELKSAKSILYDTMSFSDVAKRYSKEVSPIWHTDFSHKCACPFHSGGEERTPSLYFSEKTKDFHCFGCSAHGDLFSFLSMCEGRPWSFIVNEMLSGGDISNEEIDNAEKQSRVYVDYDDTAFEIGVMLREYLKSFENTQVYEKEKEWVEWVFARVDDCFANPKSLSSERARSFQIQIDKEVYRRKRFMEL